MEKTLNESREKLSAGDVSRIEAAVAAARGATGGDDLAAITAATDALQRASHSLAEQLYEATRGSQGSRSSQGSRDSAGSRSPGGSNVKDAEVVDAEYVETS